MRGVVVVFIVLLWGNLFAQSIEEAFENRRLVLISDFDNTLTGPGWKTLWYLKKIPSLQTWFQSHLVAPYGGFDALPFEIPVTEKEFTEIVRDKMAVAEANGQYTPRGYQPLELEPIPGSAGRERGLTILPGFYTVTSDTFRDFRSQGSLSKLLIDNQVSRQNESSRESRFGVSFPLFQKLASEPGHLANLHVVTARAQSEGEFLDLFREWVREGKMGFAEFYQRGAPPSTINVFPMGRGEGLLYGQKLSQRKVQLVRDQIMNHYRLLASQKQQKYTLVIAENDPDTVRSHYQMLLEVMAVKEFKKHLDVFLLHAGTSQEVEGSGLPARVTTFKNGFPQAATAEETRWILEGGVKNIALSKTVTKKSSAAVALKCFDLFGRAQ